MISLTPMWKISSHSHKDTVNLNQHFSAPWLPSLSLASGCHDGVLWDCLQQQLHWVTGHQLARHSANMWKPSFPDGILQAGKRWNDTIKGEQNLTKKSRDAPSLFCPGTYNQFARCHRSSLVYQLSKHIFTHVMTWTWWPFLRDSSRLLILQHSIKQLLSLRWKTAFPDHLQIKVTVIQVLSCKSKGVLTAEWWPSSWVRV